ncbi:unnamed protein product [Nippostrongylus brasiliensis]|uniref:5-oxoprolinase (inferred by orthology to a human protein) n=1 Tax=Nippostrongylus brasiliensis TaxID=27835 RepID=A0A158QZL2_NIPBR|nr:unnamed protein product [Nippostrongylus brasiliensis]
MSGFGFAIDRGGTFTDVCVFKPDGTTRVLKVLSEDPVNYADAPTEAIRQVLEQETGSIIPRGTPVPSDRIAWIRMGTTVATNALLERKGERIALLITKGFKDLLYIGNQTRPRIFDFDIRIPEMLYEEVVEVDERVITFDDSCQMGDIGHVVETPYPAHESKCRDVAVELGFSSISLSHEVMPMIKVVPRGFTVCADAYLTPKIREYIKGFESGFSDGLKSVRVDFMQSDGGLCSVKNFFGSKAILSGPAGGVIGVALTAYDEKLDINTVAAGGGSRLFFDNGIFIVGPESVGAHPGPVCYRKGGNLAITDANLVLGRILPEYFPKIFGPNCNEGLDGKSAYDAMKVLTDRINTHVRNNPDAVDKEYSVEEAALGFVNVANEEMCRPIRAITQARGYDTSAHILACFGGAGGQHACAVAQNLGIQTVLIHKYSSLLSAYGIALAKVVSEVQEPANVVFSSETVTMLSERLAALSERATVELQEQGFSRIRCESFLHMRFAKTDCAIMVTADYDPKVDPIRLSIFSNRFMSIAEQMGRVLQRTAISTNIKERLDFSCALFSPDGGLIANAPHIPVHLGGMQYAVRYQIDHLGMESIRRGDVILSNHPRAGGSHLPDLTIITPVFFENHSTPVFFLANRGHHADIGGIVPGSMPPNATTLDQEGAAFESFKVVEGGVFREDALGISLVCDLISEYGLEVVQAYMQHIQSTAEESVREMLKDFGRRVLEKNGETRLEAFDFMDDGTRIQLTITIDIEKGEAMFDFAGTGMEVFSSCNCPRAISIPEGTILSPSELAAVVGGNVLTSQRLCDVILGAFEAVAASQGCMNNVTFGDEAMGYYETIAGGAGAGEGFDGRSGVHTHMTNTRITDPEILESRYPVVLREFSLRENSGGGGKWCGGDGVVRSLQFRRPLSLSLLTERRVFAPYGLKGGKSGACGVNVLKRQSRTANLGGKITMRVEAGDLLQICTPGGGGYGSA